MIHTEEMIGYIAIMYLIKVSLVALNSHNKNNFCEDRTHIDTIVSVRVQPTLVHPSEISKSWACMLLLIAIARHCHP